MEKNNTTNLSARIKESVDTKKLIALLGIKTKPIGDRLSTKFSEESPSSKQCVGRGGIAVYSNYYYVSLRKYGIIYLVKTQVVYYGTY